MSDRAVSTGLLCVVSLVLCDLSLGILCVSDVAPRIPTAVATPTGSLCVSVDPPSTPTQRTCSHGKRLHTQSLRHIG